MLCASVLAELEAAVPIDKRLPPPSGDVASETSADSSDKITETESTASVPSIDSGVVGKPRDFSGHADGTSAAYNSLEKWIVAALKKLGKEKRDLVLTSLEPNNELCSQVHSAIANWHTTRTIARDAGVIDHRPSELAKPPPQDCLNKTRGWLLRYVNQARAEKNVSMLSDDKWARKLAGVKADAKAVNKKTKQLKAESGILYHHKHDVAPTQEQLVAMCYVGFSADQYVDDEVLDSLEAGMAISLYLPTGARGSELKKMHLQSLGHEAIQDEKSGLTFECLKLTAFETKTKQQHLNQFLAHSNPWRCGVGLLGLSLLVRVKMYGAMPFTMKTDANSWKIIGTNVDTLDRRIKETFKVAGIRRQLGDPLTLLGRHFGTRLLQHAGGSTEGGAARRGHSNGTAAFHYTECPLPDLLKLAGNDSGKPFVPAHHQTDLYPLADAVLLIIFPELAAHEKALDKRQKEVDAMRGNVDKVRTDEQLNDQERLIRSIRFACRIALCCLVARPRTWQQWEIIKDDSSVWKRACDENHRVVKTLFGGNTPAIHAMNALALEVIRFEEAEIKSRLASPDNSACAAVTSAVYEVGKQAAADRAKFNELLVALTAAHANNNVVTEPLVLPPPAAEAIPNAPPEPSSIIVAPLAGLRLKRKRESQDDVTHFSTWTDLGNALQYAKDELGKREKDEGAAWRILKLEDGGESRSRHRQWHKYRSLAIAVGVLIRSGKSYEESVKEIQSRFDAMGAKYTQFEKAINEEIKKLTKSDAEAIAKDVIGY
jgi:hypothetical protein